MEKTLAINSGSSSLKWQLYEMPEEKVIAKGIFDYVKNSNFMYLPCNDIIDNPMYHPFSPQIKKERSLPILEKFIQLYEKN